MSKEIITRRYNLLCENVIKLNISREDIYFFANYAIIKINPDRKTIELISEFICISDWLYFIKYKIYYNKLKDIESYITYMECLFLCYECDEFKYLINTSQYADLRNFYIATIGRAPNK